MLTIFAESPWPGMIIFMITGITFYLFWDQSGKNSYLGGVVLSLLGIAAAFTYDSLHITLSEEIEITVSMLAHDCESNDIEKTVNHIDPNAGDIQQIVRTGMSLVKVQPRLRITDVHVTLLRSPGGGEPTRGISHFRANGTVTLQGTISTHIASRWKLTWEKAAGSWKIIKLDRLDPISGDVIATLDHKLN